MNNRIVIIPTYNEIENITAIIEKVLDLKPHFNVLIVDDGSPDGTANAVKLAQKENPSRIYLIERKGKMGLGTAYIAGFKWSIENNYDFIFEMDADFSHNPEDLVKLKSACIDGSDLAIGSRYIKGVNVVNWPMSRVLMSYFASVYVRLITRINIQDATAGFKCYRRIVLETIPLQKIKFIGYAFQIEMKFASWKLGFKIAEVPITFIDRQLGESKMNKGIVKEGILGVLKLRWQSLFKNYRKKVKNTVYNDTVNFDQQVALEQK